MRAIGTLVLALAGVLLLAGSGLAIEAEEWSQERATSLARDLSKAADGLYTKAKLEENQAWSTKQADNYLLVEDIKAIKRHTNALLRHLEKGEGREETSNLFDRIVMVVMNARTSRRSAQILQGAQSEIDAARGVLEELARQYGREIPPLEQGE